MLMNKKDDRFLEVLKSFIQSFIFSLLLVILITQLVIRPVRVEGLSMYPSLNDKELGFSNILSLRLKGVERFDVVVIQLEDQNKFIVKRVIGLPGEEIEYKDETLYVDGEAVEESFLENEFRQDYLDNDAEFMVDFGPIQVGEDDYFVLGDNRPNSIDSRNYGLFNREMIRSKDVVVIFPFKNLRKVGSQ